MDTDANAGWVRLQLRLDTVEEKCCTTAAERYAFWMVLKELSDFEINLDEDTDLILIFQEGLEKKWDRWVRISRGPHHMWFEGDAEEVWTELLTRLPELMREAGIKINFYDPG